MTQAFELYGATKPPLQHDQLRGIINLALWTGQLLLQNGAETRRVEETVHRVGTALGCDWMDVEVSVTAIVVSASSGEEFRTRVRRVVRPGMNSAILEQVNDLSYRAVAGKVSIDEYRRELERISAMTHSYNRWVVVLMIGLACASYCWLFGGDEVSMAVTFVASAVAMTVRQELTARHFNPYITIIATAFVATCIASTTVLFSLTDDPQPALSAAVLLLVPGTQLINSAVDMMRGFTTIGLVRGFHGLLVSLSISLGIILALRLLNVGVL